MLAIALLALLGIGASAFLIDDIVDDARDDARDALDEFEDAREEGGDDDDMEDAPPEPIVGTDEADGYFGNPDDSGVTYDLRGGDDVLHLSDQVGITVNGGDGDDILILENSEDNEISGDDGNDHLISGVGNDVDGGDGNDTIEYDLSTGLFDGVRSVEGGDGADTISVESTVGNHFSDFSSIDVTGGEGADRFEVALDQQTPLPYQDPGDFGEGDHHTGIHIRDFTPSEDVLVVDVTQVEETGDRALTSAELVEGLNDRMNLVLNFAATDISEEMRATIVLSGSSGITLDDIVIVQS